LVRAKKNRIISLFVFQGNERMRQSFRTE